MTMHTPGDRGSAEPKRRKPRDKPLFIVVTGHGKGKSTSAFGMLLRAYAGPGSEVLYSRHGFLMYPIGALSVGATPVAAPERDLTADVDALLERVTERTRIVFIANPNNPTGTYLPISEMRRPTTD